MKIVSKITISFFITGIVLAEVIVLFSKSEYYNIMLYVSIPVIAGIIGYYIGLRLSEPIGRLQRALSMVRSGNLEYKVGDRGEDEIGEMSKEFNRIVRDLKTARTDLENMDRERVLHEKTTDELKEKERYYRQLFEYSNDAVFIYDLDGNIIDINDKATEMLGYSKEDLLKKPFLNLHIEGELERTKEAFKSEKGAYSIRFESKFRRKDGEMINVEISSSVVDLKNGIMQAIVANITERKRLEEALKGSEERFRSFMENASDLMYITDKDGKLIYANLAMINTLGYYRENIIEKHITELMDEKSQDEYASKNQQMIASGDVLFEPVWETKDRRKMQGELRVSAIYDDDGNFVGSRGIFRDISERKKIEESQRLAQLGRLASDMAHEVNNPLTVISGRVQLFLMDDIKDKKDREALEIIMDQCTVAQDLIQRVLMFSRPGKGFTKEVDINDSLEYVISLVKNQFKQGNIKIERELSKKLPVLKVDEKQMQEVFMNLLRNAFDAMVEGGKITVSSAQEDDRVRIDFTDTGSGISPEDMKKIFDPFFTTKDNGTGLGLSVCYGIIKSHKGSLVYTSEPGKGTTATVFLKTGYEGH
ncbi:MAG: PAS domain S-box protein [Candidatus Omnitrophica bacterium]|nr:PAS domain S-box protein [Candidatus Omnitrophota bacterium]